MPKKETKLENLSKTVYMLVEETRLSELEDLDYIFMEHYTQLAGNDKWVEIYDFTVDEKGNIKKYLELKNGIPSHDTLQRFLLSSVRKNCRIC